MPDTAQETGKQAYLQARLTAVLKTPGKVSSLSGTAQFGAEKGSGGETPCTLTHSLLPPSSHTPPGLDRQVPEVRIAVTLSKSQQQEVREFVLHNKEVFSERRDKHLG